MYLLKGVFKKHLIAWKNALSLTTLKGEKK